MNISNNSQEIGKQFFPKNIRCGGVSRLTLKNFRNYENLRLEVDSRPVILTGANGSGKTNILEALSFLVGSGGLRGSRLSEVTTSYLLEQGVGSWAVAADIDIAEFKVTVSSGFGLLGKEGRSLHVNGKPAKNENSISEILDITWLTPSMDGVFRGPPSERRRFLDRLVSIIDSQHLSRCSSYERAFRDRSRLFREGVNDTIWYESLEDILSSNGVAITAARHDFVSRINLIFSEEDDLFPVPKLYLKGEIDDWLRNWAAIDAEQLFKDSLRESREGWIRNRKFPITSGPNRTDLEVYMHNSRRIASECSTGEQKALLISIILGHLQIAPANKSQVRLLLLDEVVAHLDEDRIHHLFDRILKSNTQAWITGTDKKIFSDLGELVQIFNVDKGEISPTQSATDLFQNSQDSHSSNNFRNRIK